MRARKLGVVCNNTNTYHTVSTVQVRLCRPGVPDRYSLTKVHHIRVNTPSRYIEPIFNKVDIEKDILYREAVNIHGNMEKLFLDVYQPNGDTEDIRPAIDFAKKGYVTISINYRLRNNPIKNWVGTFVDSTDDAAAAVDWLVKNSKKYRVDIHNIAIGGHSAGALISTILTYKDGKNAVWNKDSIIGVINLSGGGVGLGTPDKSDPPCLSIHGKRDTILAYSESVNLTEKLGEIGIKASLHTLERADHNLSLFYPKVLDTITEFLYKIITGKDPK